MPHQCPSTSVLFARNLALLYNSLNAENELKIILDNVAFILKENAYAGKKVKKKQIPKYYIDTHKVHVIYRLRIEKCRVIYTLGPEGKGTKTLVIECFTNHKSYAKRFGYKT